ncbi:magnesium/cobalt transporter CorA [Bacteroides sp. 224]|uniref:magnesium/cobalt transporter CorA n=1 Tax=Bacteroides sp. 224 TaxID=2302936 RepID=UPI0013D7AA01|nr:magnesium/cobalt transporter CorA [Bacteroides sp. 224]NDV66235.1 magnesium and cobalt transport protein CorA [Bacteroides sp. 224]
MKNNLLSENLTYNGDSKTPTGLSLCSYNTTEMQEAQGNKLKDIEHLLDANRINWLQVSGLQNTEAIREICEHFEINFLILQDILNTRYPAKIEEHDKYTVVILKLFRFNEANKEAELHEQQLSIIQGSNFLLTFLEEDIPFFENVTTAIQYDTLRIRTRQTDYLLSVLLNNAMANYTLIVNSIDDGLEDLEENLLDINSDVKGLGGHIQSLRRQYLQVKKAIFPLKEQYVKLLRSENMLMHKVNRAFFNDVNDHLQFVLQTIEICRETLSSLVDLYISNNDLRLNDIMKRLTVVSTIFIPLTFLVGVWGMNFDFMPELGWRHGYLFAWGLMAVIGLGVFFFFKGKKWY